MRSEQTIRKIMNRWTGLALCLALCAGLCGAPGAARAAQATPTAPASSAGGEAADGLHRFADIPFDTATAQEVAQMIKDRYNLDFKVEKQVLSGSAEGIAEFGYLFSLQVDFHGRYTGIDRIALHRAGSSRGTGEAFEAKVTQDVRQFLDMENQLSALYGEPDAKLFYSDAKKYGLKGTAAFQFPDGLWDEARLLAVCREDRYLVAFAWWGNVSLKLWVDWKKEAKTGYLTRLDLYYYPKLPSDQAPTLADYPPTAKP